MFFNKMIKNPTKVFQPNMPMCQSKDIPDRTKSYRF